MVRLKSIMNGEFIVSNYSNFRKRMNRNYPKSTPQRELTDREKDYLVIKNSLERDIKALKHKLSVNEQEYHLAVNNMERANYDINIIPFTPLEISLGIINEINHELDIKEQVLKEIKQELSNYKELGVTQS